jgi:hypothetical protein
MYTFLTIWEGQMLSNARWMLFYVIALVGVVLIANNVVFAGVVSTLAVEANVGVDEATRTWLPTLPQTWRDQINKIVEDTLTSGNVHLDHALIDIRKRLVAAEDEAACAWYGANQQTANLWKSHIPFLRQPEPIRDLADNIQSQRKAALDHLLEPQYMQRLYDDLENKVAVIRCEPNLSPGTKVNLESTSGDLSSRWIIWRRMDSSKCGDQDACFGNYRSAVQRSIDDAQKSVGLEEAEKSVIAKAKIDASVEPPAKACGWFWSLFSKSCYEIDNYEEKLFALGDIDDHVRLLVPTRALHQKIDGAVLTTRDVDPGILRLGSTIKSPNNAYFAVMQSDCNFQIYKGSYTASAERLALKYVVANTATANTIYSNCHLDLQRDRNVVLYVDALQTRTITIPGPGLMTRRRDEPYIGHNARVWESKTGDGGNSDYWLVLLDSGKLEIHAGTPFKDGGSLFTSRLLANKALEFVKAN